MPDWWHFPLLLVSKMKDLVSKMETLCCKIDIKYKYKGKKGKGDQL